MKVQLLTVTSHYYTVRHNYPASKLYCNYPNCYTKTCCVQRTLYMPPSIVTQKLDVSKEHYICPHQLLHKNLCPKNTIYAPINWYTKTCCVQRTLYAPINCSTKTWCVQRTLYMPPSIVEYYILGQSCSSYKFWDEKEPMQELLYLFYSHTIFCWQATILFSSK